MSSAVIAIIAVIAFGLLWWKFAWPGMRENFRQMKESERKLGPVRFSLLILGTVAWIGIGSWLEIILDYPDSYGFHCQGRGCWIEDMWHSPVLLHHPNGYTIALFVWYWSMPAFVLALVGYTRWRKLRGMKFSLFADDDRGPQ